MKQNFKAIFLDLDDTLYDYTECLQYGQKEAVTFVAQELKKPEEEVLSALLSGRKEIKNRLSGTGSSHSRLLSLQTCIESLTGQTNIPLTLLAESVYWDAFVSKMKLRDGVIEFLETARKNNCTIVIVTDLTAQIQLKKLLRLGIESYVDFLVTSEESGHDKPGLASFQLAMKKSGIPAAETVMIGENYEKDILGARALGMETIYLNLDQRKEVEGMQAEDFKTILELCK